MGARFREIFARAILDEMRLAIALAVALAASGCGSRPRGAGPPPPPPVPASAQPYAAARWLPARPTYAVLFRSVGDAQRAVTGALAGFGPVVGAGGESLSRVFLDLLAVDALSSAALAEIGVDPDGGAALFSEAVNPTLVVRLADPARLQAFLDRRRERGLQAQSVRVDGVEVLTTSVPLPSRSPEAGSPARVRLGWAVDGDWLWIHFGLPFAPDEGTAWLSSSRRPGAPAWGADWQWALEGADRGARPAIVGFFDLRAVIASLSPRIPAAIACTRLLEPVGRLGVALEAGVAQPGAGSGLELGGRVSLELGPAAAALARAILPAPAAWGAAAARAPLAVQWNLDLAAVRAYVAPCAQALAIDLVPLDTYGVRTARAILQHYDPGKPTASRGAVSFDLAHRTYAAKLLDEIPGRSLIQRRRTFGPYQGYSISIPFGGPTVDYVLDDQRALAGLGDGVLAGVVGQGPGAPGPLLAIDLSPPAMSREAWAGLLRWVGRRPDALLSWSELHLAIAVDGTHLVLDASGRRR